LRIRSRAAPPLTVIAALTTSRRVLCSLTGLARVDTVRGFGHLIQEQSAFRRGMVDVASPVLGGFQDSIVDAFGATAGWWVGHLLVVGMVALCAVALQNREHIANNSGIGRSMVMDTAATLVLIAVQYVVFTGTFGWPEGESFLLAAVCALSLRWHVLIVE